MSVSGHSGVSLPVGIPPDGDAGEVLKKVTAADYDVDWLPDNDSGGGGGGAPADAQYLVAALNVTLTNERLVTPDETIVWDFSVASVAGIRVVPESSQIVLAQQIFGS